MNSDFSRRTDESIPYRDSSDLISESFIDEMSGSVVVGGMVDASGCDLWGLIDCGTVPGDASKHFITIAIT